MTITMTTLIEDVSNSCWTSGSAGMCDGVMTPRKKHWKSGCVLAQISLRKHCEKTVHRDRCKVWKFA